MKASVIDPTTQSDTIVAKVRNRRRTALRNVVNRLSEMLSVQSFSCDAVMFIAPHFAGQKVRNSISKTRVSRQVSEAPASGNVRGCCAQFPYSAFVPFWRIDRSGDRFGGKFRAQYFSGPQFQRE